VHVRGCWFDVFAGVDRWLINRGMKLADNLSADVATWQNAAVSALAGVQNTDGGWPYRANEPSSTEPTALALLALSVIDPENTAIAPAEQWLTAAQRQDGFWGASPSYTDISWISPLAGLALLRRGYTSAVQAAADALLGESVYTFVALIPGVYGLDTTIPGWPWTAGDISFAEPTALAVVFLKQAGHWNNRRVRQGVQLLHDRALAAGGWNYGEPKVLGSELYPTVLSTAMVLSALTDEQNDKTAAGLNWLLSQQGRISSLLSLGWAATALNVYGLLDDNWREDLISRWNELPAQRQSPMAAAICLLGLADVGDHPFALS